MGRIKFTPCVFLTLLIGIALFCSVPLRGAEPKPFLADRHKILELTCDQCHKENPPKEKVPMEICLNCHGGRRNCLKQLDQESG